MDNSLLTSFMVEHDDSPSQPTAAPTSAYGHTWKNNHRWVAASFQVCFAAYTMSVSAWPRMGNDCGSLTAS
jgi:hypothetical protein